MKPVFRNQISGSHVFRLIYLFIIKCLLSVTGARCDVMSVVDSSL